MPTPTLPTGALEPTVRRLGRPVPAPRPVGGLRLAVSDTRRGASREENQDVALVHGPLLAIADGVGGRPDGARAAALATATLCDALEAPAPSPAGALAVAFADANARVREEAPGSSSTLVAAHVGAGRITLAHVGDSRAYLLRDGELRALTTDHTLANAYAAGGRSPEGLEASMRRAIVRAVGLTARIEPEVRRLDARPGDLLILCSDGVSGPLGDDALGALLRDVQDPVAACAALVRAAPRTGTDDATAVVAQLD